MRRIIENLSDEVLNTIEQTILTTIPPLKITGVDRIGSEKDSLELFLLKMMKSLQRNTTEFISTKEFQCPSGRRRSQGDLFQLVRNYHDSVTFKEFRQALFALVNKRLLLCIFCGDIQKRVFRYMSREEKDYCRMSNDIFVSSLEHLDEYNARFITEEVKSIPISKEEVGKNSDTMTLRFPDPYYVPHLQQVVYVTYQQGFMYTDSNG